LHSFNQFRPYTIVELLAPCSVSQVTGVDSGLVSNGKYQFALVQPLIHAAQKSGLRWCLAVVLLVLDCLLALDKA